MMQENPTVEALRLLSIFGPAQSGAYREHSRFVTQVLGADVTTLLGQHINQWAQKGQAGLQILTGNAGTGKTAVAESYCHKFNSQLPSTDGLEKVGPKNWIVKDFSGLADSNTRRDCLIACLDKARTDQILMCANEGVLRAAMLLIDDSARVTLPLDEALRFGAASTEYITIINLNRQRPTSPRLWEELLNYLTREELWAPCEGCPVIGGGCPMRANAAALRKAEVRSSIRTLLQLATGEAVPTLREVLAIIARSIVGDHTCASVKEAARDRGLSAFTVQDSYFNLLLGGKLDPSVIERSPLLSGMRSANLGEVADLEVDEWLRDTSSAPSGVRRIAGFPEDSQDEITFATDLSGSLTHLDRVYTPSGTMTFHRLGEVVATSEDLDKVQAGIQALTASIMPVQNLWRRRVFFEQPQALGDEGEAGRRLLRFRFFPDLTKLARRAAAGLDTVVELQEIVKGLNFLVAGFSNATEGLLIPDSACLFARDPGSFRPASPSLVHGQIDLNYLTLNIPDRGLIHNILDTDHVEVDLLIESQPEVMLRIRPRIYEAIREAASFEGPVGQGAAEMNDLRGFYARLATAEPTRASLRVADPTVTPPALRTVTLPHFSHGKATNT